jgi:MFS family permease
VRHTDATLIGLNAGAVFIGVMLGPMLTPPCVRRFGIRNLLLACFALNLITFLALKVFAGYAAWFVLRMLLGMLGSSIFTATEAWISLLAGEGTRGRIIGFYAAALSAGFAIGPLLLVITGITGWPPFLANTAITATAALPLLVVGDTTRDLGRNRGGSPLAMVRRAPFILTAVALFGLYETAILALLPIWGVRFGLADSVAAATVSAVYCGAIALQVPLGWLSDRMPRLLVLQLCGIGGLTGAILLLVAPAPLPALFILLFAWGGLVSGIYPLALGMAGDRFHGQEMVTVNAAIIMAYGLGALAGPTLGGAALDLFSLQGLPGLFVVLFSAFLLATCAASFPRGRHAAN